MMQYKSGEKSHTSLVKFCYGWASKLYLLFAHLLQVLSLRELKFSEKGRARHVTTTMQCYAWFMQSVMDSLVVGERY